MVLFSVDKLTPALYSLPMDVNNFNSTVEWAKLLTRMAKDYIARGAQPVNVYKWLVSEGFSADESSRITGYKAS